MFRQNLESLKINAQTKEAIEAIEEKIRDERGKENSDAYRILKMMEQKDCANLFSNNNCYGMQGRFPKPW